MLFHTCFPRSICLPFTNAFSELKAITVISVDCCLQFFYGKLFFFFRLLSLAHSLLFHHITLLFPFCSLYCTKTGEEWAPEKLVCQVSYIAAAAKSRNGSGMGTANPVKQPSNYSELCQASQHCLTLFCISEFVLNQWTWRWFGIRSMVTVEMHTSSLLASLPSCFLKQISPSQKL